MAVFLYKAVTADGRPANGRIDALNLIDLEMRLKRMELDLISGEPISNRSLFGGKKVPRRELITFCFHLEQLTHAGAPYVGGVKVERIVDDTTPAKRMHEPANPLADDEGYVFHSNVSEVTEMVEMMAAARSYQNNVEVVNTARQLMMRTLDITKA